MKVLSLFDGMSCGQIALQQAGVSVEKYYASEIKPKAIALTQEHFPETIQLGSINDIDFNNFPDKIDLLIGGSPCQDFSTANRHSTEGLKGKKSSLFFKYLEALKVLKPKYFLLENVKMSKENQDTISSLVGVQPVNIDSKIVSAQLRNRLYWTNIPQFPIEENDVTLQDILEEGYSPKQKSRCLICSEKNILRSSTKRHYRFYNYLPINNIWKSKEHFDACQQHFEANYKGLRAKDITDNPDVYQGIRSLTQSELEKLQTVPAGYTSSLNRRDAADLLGDGWTVKVIEQLFRGLK